MDESVMEGGAPRLLAEVEVLLVELDAELEDLARGRQRTTTNARMHGIAIGVRLRFARRGAPNRLFAARIAELDARWCAALRAVARFEALDAASAR